MAVGRRDLKLQQVQEEDASGEVAEVYGRIKESLRANVVNFVWRVFATKPKFLSAVWGQLEPSLDKGFMEAAEGIRALAIERVREAAPVPDHRGLLGDDLARASEELRVFLEVNPRLLILLCALRRSWRNGEVGGLREAEPADRGIPPWHPMVEMADGGLFQGKLRSLYDEIREVLDLPEPNTDYRVLGKWPDYLEHAWVDLRAFIPTESWRAACVTADWVAEQAAVALPARITASPGRAQELGLEAHEVNEVGAWIDAFHGLLPGLIVNDSYFWLGMLGGVERLPAPAPSREPTERVGEAQGRGSRGARVLPAEGGEGQGRSTGGE